MFVKTDETPEFIKAKAVSAIYHIEAQSVPMRAFRSNNERINENTAVFFSDSRILPLWLSWKSDPNGRILMCSRNFLPYKISVRCQGTVK